MENNKFSVVHFIKKSGSIHKFMYALFAVLCVAVFLGKGGKSSSALIVELVIAASMFLVDVITTRLTDEFSEVVKWMKFTQLVLVSFIQPLVYRDEYIVCVCEFMFVILSVEFMIFKADFDDFVISDRKIFVISVAGLTAAAGVAQITDYRYICFFVVKLLSVLVSFALVNIYITQNNLHFKEKNLFMVEKSSYEDANQKLKEYQDRMMKVNERTNYQKIELAKVNKELEQNNIEMEAQNSIMTYLASTFDVLKCANHIANEIFEVKKVKFCSIYIDQDVYMNKYPSFIIKSNYSSMQRRLKKEIDAIYKEFANSKSEPKVYNAEEIKQFSFIKDTNINTIAVLPLKNNKKTYGIMMIASDIPGTFDDNLTFYETCVAEFNVSMNSTILYLKVEDVSRKDGLTGIFNRLYFNEILDKNCKNAVKFNQPISVALYDIDKFKSVNDTYGHLAGDEVIKMVARVGQKYADLNDGFVCRYGGEEFLLVFPNKTKDETLAIIEKMHDEFMATDVVFEDKIIHVNTCIGISAYPETCDNTNLLVSRADKAMYYGKEHGRGRIVLDGTEE